MRYENLLASRYIKAQKRQSLFTVVSITAAVAIMTVIFTLYGVIMHCTRETQFSAAPYHLSIHELTEEQSNQLKSIEPVSSVTTKKSEDGTVTAYLLFDKDFGDGLVWIQTALKQVGAEKLFFSLPAKYEWNDTLLTLDGIGNGAVLFKLRIFCIFFIFAVLAAMALRFVIDTAFEVSSKERERHYGVLQSVGATPEQIVRIITREAMRLCIIAIPFGLGLGILLSYGMFRAVMAAGLSEYFMSLTDKTLSLSYYLDWRMLPVAAVVGIVWVFLSAYGVGMRIIKKTPMEAITARENDVTKVKKHSLSGLLFGISGSIAARNARRQKKRFFITVLTLTISLTMVALFSTLTEAVEKAALTLIKLDYGMSTAESNTDFEFQLRADSNTGRTFEDSLKEVEDSGLFEHIGVTVWESVRQEALKDDGGCYIEYINKEEYDRRFGERTSVSYEELADARGYLCNSAVLPLLDEDTLTIQLPKRPDVDLPGPYQKVRVIGTIPQTSDWGPVYGSLIGTLDTYELLRDSWFGRKNNAECSVAVINRNGGYNAADYNAVKKWLNSHPEAVVRNEEWYGWDLYGEKLKLHSIMAAVRAGVMMLNILIAVTALINLMNIISTGIANRRSELASLQCVGMTDRQLDRMAVIECLQFAGAAAIISALICALVVFGTEYGLLPWLADNAFAEEPAEIKKMMMDMLRMDHIAPFVRIVIGAAAAFLAGCITSLVMLRRQRSDSLSDQIRGTELKLDLTGKDLQTL